MSRARSRDDRSHLHSSLTLLERAQAGDRTALDTLIARLGSGGEVVHQAEDEPDCANQPANARDGEQELLVHAVSPRPCRSSGPSACA